MKIMKIYTSIILILLFVLPLAGQEITPKKIIYETDMCLDVDDVGGLAILHALANNGEAEILGVSFNEVHPSGAATIDAINTWYGRGDIPIGVYKGVLNNPDGSGYLDAVAKFPHDLDNNSAMSSLELYRQVLSQQPDSSVTIISVGFLNNINDLLLAEPELVARKVKELVQMAGVNNDGFNLVRHNLVSASQNVIENWPTPLVISQEGSSILTGDNLQSAPEENPVREAFYKFFGNSFKGRPSWDEMAVLYGVRGTRNYFNLISSGTGSLSNGYVWHMKPGFRSYLTNRYGNSTYEKIIEELMDQLPIGAHFEASVYSGWLPLSVHFDASGSVVGGNRSVDKYLWNFGDGTRGEGKTISHEYSETGCFDVLLQVVDNTADTLRASDQVCVSDPVFGPDPFYGNVQSYTFNQPDLWSTQIYSEDLRLYLDNKRRKSNVSMAGYGFIKDSLFTDFTMNFQAATGEDLSQNSLADYSLIFGYQDAKNYNQLLMKHGTSRLMNITNGRNTAIKWTTEYGIPDEQIHDIKLNLEGNELTVTLDDSVFLLASSSYLLKSGKIGFGSGQYAAFFDNIRVSSHGTATKMYITSNVPGEFLLGQNYPNPFNPHTRIPFTLKSHEHVIIEIYTPLGQMVETILNQPMPAGKHEIIFTAKGLNSGVYLYKIKAGKYQEVGKMILLK